MRGEATLNTGGLRAEVSRARRRTAWPRRAANLFGSLLLTFFGLLAITFVIGRVVPIDPVLAIVGDRALPQVYARVRQELALDEPDLCAVLDLFDAGAPWRSRHIGRSARARSSRTCFTSSRRPSNWRPLATLLGVLIGVPMGVIGATRHGRWPDHLHPHRRPDRLFGAGVLARAGRACSSSTPSWTGSPGPAASTSSMTDIVDPVTGLMLVDAALAGEWDVFCNAVTPPRSCRRRSSAISPWPISAA